MSQRDPSATATATATATRSWLDGMRRMSGEPLLSRLRYLDRGPAFDVRGAGDLLELVDDRDDSWWLGDGVVRGLDAGECARVLAAFRAYEGSNTAALGVRREVHSLMGARAAPALLAELRAGPSEDVLEELENLARDHAELPSILAASADTLRALLEPGRSEIEDTTRRAVARLLLRANCSSDEVRRLVIADLEALPAMLALGSYDLLVDAEEWLTLLGTLDAPSRTSAASTNATPRTYDARFLAPHLAPILRCEAGALRVAAAQAALGLRDASLVPALLHALDRDKLDEIGGPRERAIACAALWRLTGESTWIDRMRAEAGDGIVALTGVVMALAASSLEEAELLGLVELAKDPVWMSSIYGVFAEAGPAAAAAIAQLDEPPRDADHYVAYHEARWRAGLASAEEMTLAIEPRLAWSAWGLYLRADVRSERWAARIRKEIAACATGVIHPAIAHELGAHPAVAAQFLPVLRRHGYAETIRILWRKLPKDVFWRALGEEPTA